MIILLGNTPGIYIKSVRNNQFIGNTPPSTGNKTGNSSRLREERPSGDVANEKNNSIMAQY